MTTMKMILTCVFSNEYILSYMILTCVAMKVILTCVAGIDNCGKCLPFHPQHPHLSTHFLHHHQREDGEEDDDEENDDED